MRMCCSSPSQAKIFNLFTNLFLLKKGNIVYQVRICVWQLQQV